MELFYFAFAVLQTKQLLIVDGIVKLYNYNLNAEYTSRSGATREV